MAMRRLLGGVVAAVLILTGACGSDDEGATGPTTQRTPLEVVVASSTKTAEARSSKMAFTVVSQGLPGASGQAITITGEGAFDYAARQGSFAMDIPAIAGVQVGRVEAVSTGTTIYQKFPPQLASFLGGKSWVKIDLNQLGQSAGIDFNSISQASSADPTQAFQFLKGAGVDVVELGKEQVRGEAVTHYRGTVDANKAAAAAPPEQQKALQQLAQIYSQPLPMEVWIDDEGRLRKMTYAVDLSKLNLPPQATAGHEPTGSINFTLELFDFGTPVSVTVPPADQVADLGQLLAGATRR